MTASPAQLAGLLGRGLLSFPVTFFDDAGAFNEAGYREHISRQGSAGAAGLFAAGGTGEFFSLTPEEYKRVVQAAVSEVHGGVPILAGVGYGTAMAIAFARAAESAGADGVLVFPPYLVKSEQEGLRRHLTAICRSVGIGVVAYNRDNAVFNPETLARVAEDCPNLIGVKDGLGDIELLTAIRCRMGDRLVLIGGMPTAEVYARSASAIGVGTYSSAIYNFAPGLALRFHGALLRNGAAEMDDLMRRFFMPYLAIRNRRAGYAIAIVKAGVRAGGIDCGAVRPPLVDLTEQETNQLAALIEAATRPR